MNPGATVAALEHEVRARIQAFVHLVSGAELEAAERLALETLQGLLRAQAAAGGADHTSAQPPLQPLAQSASTNTRLGARRGSDAQATWPAPNTRAIHENAHRAFSWLPPEQDTAMPASTSAPSSTPAQHLPLDGVALAVKANIAVHGWPLTACSALYRDQVATEDAAVITALRNAGATFVGLTNMDELAWGGTSDNPLHGATLNPHGSHLSASGSSGGSAVAVAEGSVSVALGTDTGGSVRLPAAACGVVGFRPSTHAVSSVGVVPLAESFDTVGVLGNTVTNVRAVSEILMNQRLVRDLPGTVRIGIIPALMPFGADEFVASRWQGVQQLLQDEGCVLEEVWIAGMREFFDVWFFTHLIEPARAHIGETVERVAAVGPSARVPLIAGACLPPELEEQAQHLRAHFNGLVTGALTALDFVVSPTFAAAPQRIDAQTISLPQGEASMFKFSPAATWLASMAGLPAVSIPVPTGSLPVGMQIMGARGDDAGVLSFAQRLEQWLDQKGAR